MFHVVSPSSGRVAFINIRNIDSVLIELFRSDINIAPVNIRHFFAILYGGKKALSFSSSNTNSSFIEKQIAPLRRQSTVYTQVLKSLPDKIQALLVWKGENQSLSLFRGYRIHTSLLEFLRNVGCVNFYRSMHWHCRARCGAALKDLCVHRSFLRERNGSQVSIK